MEQGKPFSATESPLVDFDAVCQKVRAAVEPARAHAVSLHDEHGDVLWLSESSMGPDEHNAVREALEAFSSNASPQVLAYDLGDSRSAVLLHAVNSRRATVGAIMLIMDTRVIKQDHRGVVKIMTPKLQRALADFAGMRPDSEPAPQSAAAPAPASSVGKGSPLASVKGVGKIDPPARKGETATAPARAPATTPAKPSAPARPASAHPAAAAHPATARSAASHPAASHPAASHPAASHSAASHPAASHTAASHPAASHSAASHSAASHSAASHSAASHPAASRSAASHPAASHPAAAHPPTAHPAAPRINGSKPSVPAGAPIELSLADSVRVRPTKPAVSRSAPAPPPAFSTAPSSASTPDNKRTSPEVTPEIDRLHAALRRSPIALHVQRLVPLTKGSQLKRYEVLLRSGSDDAPNAAPHAMLKAAVDNGLGSMIDRRVVTELIGWLVHHPDVWQSSAVMFSVNLTTTALHDEHFIKFVGLCLAKSSLPKAMIAFEVDVPTAVKLANRVSEVAAALDRLGCPMVLDDFALRTECFDLLRLPGVRYIKLASEVTAKMRTDKLSQAAITAVVQMARVLGMHTVAKRTETPAEQEWLTALGVDFVQSHAMSPPAAIDSLSRGQKPRS
ncbi:MAG: EAL domain-containing protein [Steroidobacteraceae bacterium]